MNITHHASKRKAQASRTKGRRIRLWGYTDTSTLRLRVPIHIEVIPSTSEAKQLHLIKATSSAKRPQTFDLRLKGNFRNKTPNFRESLLVYPHCPSLRRPPSKESTRTCYPAGVKDEGSVCGLWIATTRTFPSSDTSQGSGPSQLGWGETNGREEEKYRRQTGQRKREDNKKKKLKAGQPPPRTLMARDLRTRAEGDARTHTKATGTHTHEKERHRARTHTKTTVTPQHEKDRHRHGNNRNKYENNRHRNKSRAEKGRRGEAVPWLARGKRGLALSLPFPLPLLSFLFPSSSHSLPFPSLPLSSPPFPPPLSILSPFTSSSPFSPFPFSSAFSSLFPPLPLHSLPFSPSSSSFSSLPFFPPLLFSLLCLPVFFLSLPLHSLYFPSLPSTLFSFPSPTLCLLFPFSFILSPPPSFPSSPLSPPLPSSLILSPSPALAETLVPGALKQRYPLPHHPRPIPHYPPPPDLSSFFPIPHSSTLIFLSPFLLSPIHSRHPLFYNPLPNPHHPSLLFPLPNPYHRSLFPHPNPTSLPLFPHTPSPFAFSQILNSSPTTQPPPSLFLFPHSPTPTIPPPLPPLSKSHHPSPSSPTPHHPPHPNLPFPTARIREQDQRAVTRLRASLARSLSPPSKNKKTQGDERGFEISRPSNGIHQTSNN
ncbi:hypothetical protein C7M84_021028 [Penaeus vannamei]|uniref:Uncharacterized protein n=1 Tax=Penaeus vannamei TaxID=6689 RepID=A0A3R7PCB7_PENVA|nr:hypothetical protein C7M84_021028 [Penaeus vannamei]